MFKVFGISFVSFIILDFVWLGFVVKRFNLQQMAEIGRIENGDFSLIYAPALVVYLLMAALVTFFVLPRISLQGTGAEVFLWGASWAFVFGAVSLLTWKVV
jgi:uncharacterized membrane protein